MTARWFVVFVGVEQGIVVAMAFSLFRIVHHSYRPHTAVLKAGSRGIWRCNLSCLAQLTEPGLVIYRFGAPLFYANANHFSEEVRMLATTAASPMHWVVVDAGRDHQCGFHRRARGAGSCARICAFTEQLWSWPMCNPT